MIIFFLCIFFLCSVIQLYFWIIFLDGINRISLKNPALSDPAPSVSLIISVKNEINYLRKHLDIWLKQDYESLDIIIVNDHSDDDSLTYLNNYNHPSLHVLTLPQDKQGKKAAMTFGIDYSNSDWIITTDADCYPESESWITSMMNGSHKSDIILGYSPYLNNQSLLSSLISYESWYVAMQYLNAALNKSAYMGVGRNMAFRHSVFKIVEGYTKHQNVLSGDDDLFINSLPKDTRINIAIDRQSWVWTHPATSLIEYINQKRRHLTTAPNYKIEDRLKLMIMYASQLFWYVSILMLSIYFPWMISILLIRYMVLYVIAYRSKKLLHENINRFLVPFYDFFLCVYYFLLSFTYLFPRKQW